MFQPIFRDRHDAGERLASALSSYARRPDVVVLALPRGGVPVGFEIARALDVPLDVFVVRKLGVPGHEEFAMGAIATGGVRVLNQEAVEGLELSDAVVEAAVRREQVELQRRERDYRGDRPPPDIRGRTVILVDDGLATGSTMRAAVTALRSRAPGPLVVAVPVGAAETCRSLAEQADEVLCLATPEPFRAVGLWYHDFAQTSDEEVRDLLRRAGQRGGDPRPAHGGDEA